jgi:hypothetical protein
MIKPLWKSEFTNQEAINQAKSVRMEELYDWGDPFMPF